MFRDNKVSPRSDSPESGASRKQHSSLSCKINSSGATTNGVRVQTETEETSLLSQLDNKYIKNEFAGPTIYLGACCCPCLLLGHLESKVMREPSCSCCATSCPRVSFGKTGCQTCLITGLFCSFGWPCSPCLTCYLNSHSTSISNIYDKNLETRSCCCQHSSLLWPKTVLQHLLLYEQLEKEGRLFYDWTLNSDVQKSFQREQFEMSDTAILIVGGNKAGKTDLLMKLCHRNLYEKRDTMFENNEVRVGFKPVLVTNTQVSSLEFWDIPPLHLQSIHTIRAPISHVLLVFDVNNIESFHEMKRIYKEVKNELRAMTTTASSEHINNEPNEPNENNENNVDAVDTDDTVSDREKYIVVAAKHDYLFHKTTAEGRWEADSHYEILAEVSGWAGEHNMKFISTSATYNAGVNDLMKMLRGK